MHEVIVANNGGDNVRRIGELRRQGSLGPLLGYPRSCQNSSPALPLLFCSTLVQSTWACCRSVTILYFGYIWCKDRAHLTILCNARVQYWHDWPIHPTGGVAHIHIVATLYIALDISDAKIKYIWLHHLIYVCIIGKADQFTPQGATAHTYCGHILVSPPTYPLN